MSPPTLFQIAAKSVAQRIHNEEITFDFNLDTKSSNAVFRELLELNPRNIKKLKTHKNQLSTLTELDLRKCKIDEEGVLNLKNFNLISLEFGYLRNLITEFPDYSRSQPVDIVSILERAVNTNSRKAMIHLGVSCDEEFMSGWEEKVSKLFPSLQSMKIRHKEFNERFQFSNLCYLFPKLRILDTSSPRGLSTLSGIRNLKNLQKLVIHNIPDINGYEELSELKNLRVLDVSCECDSFVFIPVIRHLLTAEVRMENLEFLDCSMTTVQEHELRTFVEHHPKLKTVVAISTSCENLSIPTINLLNFITATSTVKCLKYAIGNERCNLVRRCMDVIPEKLNIIHEQLNDSEITELLNALCYVLRESKDDRIKHRAINCLSKSNFFETERFFSSFSLEIPGIVELVFKTCDNFECIRFQHAARRSVFFRFQLDTRFFEIRKNITG